VELGLDKVVKKFLLEIVIIVEFAWDRNRKEYSHGWFLTTPTVKNGFFWGAMLSMEL
jgi:hypothetical protein